MIIPGFIYFFIIAIEIVLYAILFPLLVLSRPFIPQQLSGGGSGGGGGGGSSVSISFPGGVGINLGLDVSGQLEGPGLLAGFPPDGFTTLDPSTDNTDYTTDVSPITTESSMSGAFMPLKAPDESGQSVSDALLSLTNPDGSIMSASEALASLTNPDGSIKIPEDLDSTQLDPPAAEPPVNSGFDAVIVESQTKNKGKTTKFMNKLKNNPFNKAISKKNQAKKKAQLNKKKDVPKKFNFFDAMKERFVKPLSKRKNDRQFEQGSHFKGLKRSFLTRKNTERKSEKATPRLYM